MVLANGLFYKVDSETEKESKILSIDSFQLETTFNTKLGHEISACYPHRVISARPSGGPPNEHDGTVFGFFMAVSRVPLGAL